MGFGACVRAYIGSEHGWMGVNEDDNVLGSWDVKEGQGVADVFVGVSVGGRRISVEGLGFIRI